MTDRELLEKAAKAAGLILFWGITDPMVECHEPEHPNKTHNLWNPLADDGDALRLAVKCCLNLSLSDYGSLSVDGVDTYTEEFGDGDPYAATRRAIVRAAASIGETT